MSTIEIKEVSPKNKKELKEMLFFPWELYKNDPTWVPPLKLALLDMFSPKHPFYETGVVKNWVAKREGKVAGRISAIVNNNYNDFHQEKTGFFGFYESIEDQEVSDKLFEQAESWLKEQKMEKVLGPMNPSTNYECGLLVDGFQDPPQIMMTYNPKYYQTQIENRGFKKAKDLLAFSRELNFDLPEVIKKIAKRAESRHKITYRPVSKKDWQNEVDRMLDVYNDAWEKNWGFVPQTEAEFRHTAKDLKDVVDERLVIFAEVEGEIAGFIVGLPDLHQVFKKIPNGKLLPFGIFKLLNFKKHVNRMRIPTMGVKSKYRKLGLGSLMYQKLQEEAIKAGYKEWEGSWILEDNKNMVAPMERMGAKAYKTYRIFEKEL